MATLRDYQIACRDAVLAAWNESRSVLANLTTSAGKTVIAGSVIEAVINRDPSDERDKCLFIADTDELCEQPAKSFERHFGIRTQLEKANARASDGARVVIGSAQTLARESRLKEWRPDQFGYIFVDEAHRGSDRNQRITDYFSRAKVMGMTATAFRANLKDLSKYYERVAFEMAMFDLIGEGYISPINVLTLPVSVDISTVRQKGGDYDEVELDTKIRPYYEEICRLAREHARGRQIVVFLPLIKSSMEFARIARAMGINAAHIDGQSPDRSQLKRSFEERKIQMLCNSSLLSTGWDCPPCDCLLNLAPTRSAGLFRQKVGRIGRVLPGIIDGLATKEERIAAIAASRKPNALIIDLLWQTQALGLQTAADLIAESEEERRMIQTRLAGLRVSKNLEAVTAEVQHEKEAALKKALIDAAARQASATDSIQLIAAMCHWHKVANYEPVMQWEYEPVSEKQTEWFLKRGIDPKSAKDRGHASLFMNLTFSRERAHMAPWRAIELLETGGYAGGVTATNWQAYEILGGSYPMGFGKKHKGKPLKSVPVGFWEFALKSNSEAGSRQGWFQRMYPVEFKYANKAVNPDGDCKCIGAYRAPNCPMHPRVERKTQLAFPDDWAGVELDPKRPRIH